MSRARPMRIHVYWIFMINCFFGKRLQVYFITFFGDSLDINHYIFLFNPRGKRWHNLIKHIVSGKFLGNLLENSKFIFLVILAWSFLEERRFVFIEA